MKNVVKQYFDKSRFLTTKNKAYAETCLQLFDFLTQNDVIENDTTSLLIKGKYKDYQAFISSGESGIVAGVEEVAYMLGQQKTALQMKIIAKDGTLVKKKDMIIEFFGNPLEILSFERTILNILARMSGIATYTNYLIKKNNLKTYLAATRKTLWGLLDKKAVSIGGGLTHRLSLSDEVLIKDNHIDIIAENFHITRLESLEKILTFVKKNQSRNPFEIEVETEQEAYFLHNSYQKMSMTISLIMMLDNFKPSVAARTIETIHQQTKKDAHPVIFELSGGINEANLKNYDKVGADVLSIGSLTHSSKALDISLKLI